MSNEPKNKSIKIPTSTLELPDYLSVSVGGTTVYGTTPGGTKIRYKIDDLIKISRSPLSNRVPKGLKTIPGLTTEIIEEVDVSGDEPDIEPLVKGNESSPSEDESSGTHQGGVFSLD